MPLLFKNLESGIPRDPRTRICRSFRWTRVEEDALILVMRSVRESAYQGGHRTTKYVLRISHGF